MTLYVIENSKLVDFCVSASSPELAEVLIRSVIAKSLGARNRSIWAPFTTDEAKARFYSECSRLLRNGFRVRVGYDINKPYTSNVFDYPS